MEVTLPRLAIFTLAWWLTAPFAARLYFEWVEVLGAAADCSREEQDARVRGMARILRVVGALMSLLALSTLL